MHPNLTSALATSLLWVALIAATGCRSDASARQPANPESAAPKVVAVVIREFKFEPETLTVNEGDTVEWRNDDAVPHTATADGEVENPVFDSGNIQTGAAWRYIAQKKGTYNYICTLHPNMKGKLIVQ